MKKLWGAAAIKNAAMREEFRRHAWRMARLNRIRMMAEAAGKADVVSRVDALAEKERKRHTQRMDQLKKAPDAPSGAEPAGGAASAKPAASAGGAP